jgi:hypothetical protein
MAEICYFFVRKIMRKEASLSEADLQKEKVR